MLSLEGKQLGNYDILRRIRVGGMGAVYEGRQRTAFDRRVAIKVILGDYATDPDMRRRFAREAKTVARLHHPHILALIEFGDEQGILYLVMPFIDGGTLTSYLRHNLPSLGEVATLYEQVLDAVECAHDHGLIHRDIKSSNVLLELRRNTPPYAYLADFGLVRTVQQNTSNQVGKPIPLEQVPGTPHYMAPEQTLGIVTPLTDIYALGVLLFQMLTGNLPYNDADDVRVIQMHLHAPIPSPCEHDASIPSELGEVVKKAMAKRPENRFRTVAELRKAFFQALDGPLASLPVTEDVTPTAKAKPTRPIEPEEATQIIIDQTHGISAKNKKTIALNGRPLDPPKPIIMHQKPRGAEATPPVAVHEKRERVEHLDRVKRPDNAEHFFTTESVQQRPRITEEPIISRPRKHKRFLFPLLVVIVPLILIILLIAPRIFNLNIIPLGLSIPGSSSTAMVRITPKIQKIQNSFILTASPKVKTTNLNVRTIPDRLIADDAESSTTITTTGINQTKGTQAHGIIQLINQNNTPVTVSKNVTLLASNGIQIQLTQDVTIPAKTGNPQPTEVPAIVLQVGMAGNIPPNAISGTCCKPTIYVNNPTAFQGGVDGTTTHFLSQADIDTAQTNLVNKLEKQISAQILQKIKAGEVMAGKPTYTIVNVTKDTPLNGTADAVQMSVKVEGSIPVYQKSVAESAAMTLFNLYAQKQLGKGYQLQGKPALVGDPTANTGQEGIIYLSLTIEGTWQYNFNASQIQNLRTPIRGASGDVAKTYLKSLPGVADVSVQLPFGTDHLPDSIDKIDIILSPPN